MDKREEFVNLLAEAVGKARQLQEFVLDSESRVRVEELMKKAREISDKVDALNRLAEANGRGLDKAVLDSVLDELIASFTDLNKKLDDLLAKAKD
jgi:hypothetical protein